MRLTDTPRRVVALGGGHGLSATLEAATNYAEHVTAVVSIADDGGSSGRIRKAIGGGAPGDLRQCLAAMAPGSLIRDSLNHRFDGGDLDGHAVGNLLLAGLAQASGDLVAALDELCRILGIAGRVLPATTSAVDLVGHTHDTMVKGQVAVSQTSGLSRLAHVPPNPEVPDEVLRAIADSEQVLVGPGSLFTSVLATVAVPLISSALRRCDAAVVYIANLGDRDPEAKGRSMGDHLSALQEHGVIPDMVLADESFEGFPDLGVDTVYRRVAREGDVTHDPKLLADALRTMW